MRPISNDLLAELNLTTAIQQEVTTWRNLLPPEPWQELALSRTDELKEFVQLRLRTGAHNARGIVVNTRKPDNGIRPVPVVGLPERVIYRAITNYLLRDISPPARSMQDYRAFVLGPVLAAIPENLFPIESEDDFEFQYIAEADVAAFYQYVDHAILREELYLQTSEVEATKILMEILGEIAGGDFGIPQLLDPSDQLSEIYIRILERDIVRQGLKVWRYNDDIRILARTYHDALNCLERVSDSARRLGLVLNDHKTFISKLLTYAGKYFKSDSTDDDDAQIDPRTMDPETGDYPELNEDELLEEAKSVLSRIDGPQEDAKSIELRNISAIEVRQIRSALRTLTKNLDPSGIDHIISLFLIVPTLTPRLCDYMVAMYSEAEEEIARAWDALTDRHSEVLSDWQRLWLVYVSRATGIASPGAHKRVQWLKAQLSADDSLLHAEVALTLASLRKVDFLTLDKALRMQPQALAPWYVLGMNLLHKGGQGDTARLQAVKESSPLYRLLIDE